MAASAEGGGSSPIGEPPIGDFSVDWSCADAVARRRPEATKQPSKELVASSAAMTTVVQVRIVTSEVGC